MALGVTDDTACGTANRMAAAATASLETLTPEQPRIVIVRPGREQVQRDPVPVAGDGPIGALFTRC